MLFLRVSESAEHFYYPCRIDVVWFWWIGLISSVETYCFKHHGELVCGVLSFWFLVKSGLHLSPQTPSSPPAVEGHHMDFQLFWNPDTLCLWGGLIRQLIWALKVSLWRRISHVPRPLCLRLKGETFFLKPWARRESRVGVQFLAGGVSSVDGVEQMNFAPLYWARIYGFNSSRGNVELFLDRFWSNPQPIYWC